MTRTVQLFIIHFLRSPGGSWGSRGSELYFAGQDENWGYAAYQAQKIGAAIEQGIKRRPAREKNARVFLDEDLSRMSAAVGARDRGRFAAQFEETRKACVECHRKEGVPFIQVVIPERRLSPVQLDSK